MTSQKLVSLLFGLSLLACAAGGSGGGTGGASPSATGGLGAGSGGGPAGSGGASPVATGGAVKPVTSGSYALPPPSECSNQFSVQGCRKGVASSTCGGKCANDYGPTSKNACESGKEGVPVQYGCPRFMLFADEMVQAAKDDGYDGTFNYAVVGHDPDPTNLDKGLPDSCCQCYQLVFDAPRYLTNSTITPPKPLVVQSFNTQASGAAGFDVFMGAGGLGVFNACSDKIPLGVRNGYSMYTDYPAVGQAFSGGVKPGPDSLKCDRDGNLTDALIAAPACQAKITEACNGIAAASATVQATTRQSCRKSNQADSYYHENWKVYAKRVACPAHLTQVTGCKLAPQAGLGDPDPNVRTAAQAAAAGFVNTVNNEPYHTTTMQDCCMPTCAWKNNVRAATVDGYSTFYSCLENGDPVTE